LEGFHTVQHIAGRRFSMKRSRGYIGRNCQLWNTSGMELDFGSNSMTESWPNWAAVLYDWV